MPTGQSGWITERPIARFNAVLKTVSGRPKFVLLRHPDLRNTLTTGKSYDQMRPAKKGFAAVTKKFAAVLG